MIMVAIRNIESIIYDKFRESIENLECYALEHQDKKENVFDTMEKVESDLKELRSWVSGFVEGVVLGR
jgi:hypothetical protein